MRYNISLRSILWFAGASFYGLMANTGAEYYYESGFAANKPLECHVSKSSDDPLDFDKRVFKLSKPVNASERQMTIFIPQDEPVHLRVSCSRQESVYRCAWNEFFHLRLDTNKVWKTQSEPSGGYWVVVEGQWAQGAGKSPLDVECRQKSTQLN